MSVDILPTALPLDASETFSAGIMPYLQAVIRKYRNHSEGTVLRTEVRDVGHEEAVEALNRAAIAAGGALNDKHKWLQKPVDEWRTANTKPSSSIDGELSYKQVPMRPRKNIVVLGSGMVAGPAVDELCKRQDVHVIVGLFSFPLVIYGPLAV